MTHRCLNLTHTSEDTKITRNSRRPEVFCKKLFQASDFIKKETLAQFFSVNFAKLLRTSYFTEHLRWLLLNNVYENSSNILLIALSRCSWGKTDVGKKWCFIVHSRKSFFLINLKTYVFAFSSTCVTWLHQWKLYN